MASPTIKEPLAFLPVAMSLTALAIVVGFLARYGIVHQPDEGAAAHIFQLLLAAEVPIIAVFAIKWLPKAPQRTIVLLGVQLTAILAALAPVYFLEL
jgi:hypothetical protein